MALFVVDDHADQQVHDWIVEALRQLATAHDIRRLGGLVSFERAD
jgi:hypothetical protein